MSNVFAITLSQLETLKARCDETNGSFKESASSLIRSALDNPLNPSSDEMDHISQLIVGMQKPPMSFKLEVTDLFPSTPVTSEITDPETLAKLKPVATDAEIQQAAEAQAASSSASASDAGHKWCAMGGSIGASAITMMFGGRGINLTDGLVAGVAAGTSYAAAQYIDSVVDTSEVPEYLTGTIAACGGGLVAFAMHAGVAAVMGSNEETSSEPAAIELPAEPAEVVNQFGL